MIADEIIDVLIGLATSGDLKAIGLSFERSEGKPKPQLPDPDELKALTDQQLERLARGESL